MASAALYRKRSIIGILAGISLGYIFALDVTGWYFLKPSTLFLFEFVGGCILFRITHGLLEDERISSPAKRGYLWAVTGLISAHIINLSYLYFHELQGSFSLENVDFAQSLAISWMYMHLTILGYVFGALYEYAVIARNKESHNPPL
jgi:hypothetical protein